MMEKFTIRKESVINVQSVVQGIKDGKEDSQQILYRYLRRRFVPYFYQFSPNDAEDLFQKSAIRIFTNIERFENNGSGTYTENFRNWTQGFARMVVRMHFRSEAKSQKTKNFPDPGSKDYNTLDVIAFKVKTREGDDNIDTELDIAELSLRLRKKIAEILSEPEREVVNLKFDGKDSNEMAKQLAVSKMTVDIRLSRARKKIEERLLIPAGYERITNVADENLQDVIRRRHAAVNFLGILYITQESLARCRATIMHQKSKGKPNQELLDNGYVLVSKHLTQDQYDAVFKSPHSKLIIRKNGRVYMKKAVLETFIKERSVNEPRKFIISGQEYYSPSYLAQTTSEYHRFYRAIVSGKLPSLRKESRMFVTKDAVAEFRRNEKQNRASALVEETIIFDTIKR